MLHQSQSARQVFSHESSDLVRLGAELQAQAVAWAVCLAALIAALAALLLAAGVWHERQSNCAAPVRRSPRETCPTAPADSGEPAARTLGGARRRTARRGAAGSAPGFAVGAAGHLLAETVQEAPYPSLLLALRRMEGLPHAPGEAVERPEGARETSEGDGVQAVS